MKTKSILLYKVWSRFGDQLNGLDVCLRYDTGFISEWPNFAAEDQKFLSRIAGGVGQPALGTLLGVLPNPFTFIVAFPLFADRTHGPNRGEPTIGKWKSHGFEVEPLEISVAEEIALRGEVVNGTGRSNRGWLSFCHPKNGPRGAMIYEELAPVSYYAFRVAKRLTDVEVVRNPAARKWIVDQAKKTPAFQRWWGQSDALNAEVQQMLLEGLIEALPKDTCSHVAYRLPSDG